MSAYKLQCHKVILATEQIALYGSSYINHDEFKTHLINNNENISILINYALNSYGLDQIYYIL